MRKETKLLISKYNEELEFLERTVETRKLRITRISSVLSFFGNKRLKDITLRDAKDLRDALYFLPSNYKKLSYFNGMTFKEACRENRNLGRRGYKVISKLTVEGYISALRAFFDFLISEGLVERNPFENIKLKRKDLTRPNQRCDAFEHDELVKIFDYISSNYTPKHGFKFWLPYLLRYSGARLKELLQLESSDITKKDGVVCICIYPNEYKTLSSGRLIPVHPELIKIGFIEFVLSKNGRLFEDAICDGRAISYKASKWSSYWRAKLGFGKGKNLISFRHTFINDLKICGVDLELRAQLAGHSINTTADVYSKDYPMSIAYESICLIN
ncbi:hypothetical protein [Vibrio parahaemolyticus]|uniref:hypothetical protein n=1 Tax=Vibrio parahaemolyticus TaxID=670 RepID=UPI0022B4615B|nr:hypothetical protein [Vibrio parahaemolyticus]MCZ5867743.1 hypothetical protein [Vibrio parahaemolyticus]MCZ5897749.1 hypothetical protein [Vibrio parahaemolyticus]MCZ6021187.1 hypothetical protein [Vibrio parahaemolyticus]MCZ6306438.1 hypothetical protein [Vibrio parahaemolyticus]